MSSRRGKPSPIRVFEENIADAHRLIEFAQALENSRRPYRMRKERRSRVGSALRYSQAKADDLDWLESDHVYVIFKPEGGLARAHFTEDALRPLLRQAVVAIPAAVESFVARRACDFIRGALSDDPLPTLRARALADRQADLQDEARDLRERAAKAWRSPKAVSGFGVGITARRGRERLATRSPRCWLQLAWAGYVAEQGRGQRLLLPLRRRQATPLPAGLCGQRAGTIRVP